MKIFSNFDTTLRAKTFLEYQTQHGVDNVLCFGRSRLYALIKVILPLLILLFFTIFWLIFFYRRLGGDYFLSVFLTFLGIDLVFLFPIIGKYIDYKMDFIIVIPNAIMMYEQGWLFKRDVVTINVQSVKTISIKKSWLLYSIFDNGDLLVLTEWDRERNGEVRLRWIPKPEKRRNQIVKLIGIDTQADQNPE